MLKEKEKFPICLFTAQTPTIAGSEADQNLEPGTAAGSTMLVAGTQSLPSPMAPRVQLAES